MENEIKQLPKFITLLELTREQPQYGYFLAGIAKHETSNLAEHQYLVAMIGWMLCEYINMEEQLVDSAQVIKMCLIHDLGELFGGDIAAPLSRKRPDMKKIAKAFEAENLSIITSYLKPEVGDKIQNLMKEEQSKATNESLVCKVADLIETSFFLEHRGKKNKQKDDFYKNHIRTLAEKIENPKIKEAIIEFFDGFELYVNNQGFSAGRFILDEK